MTNDILRPMTDKLFLKGIKKVVDDAGEVLRLPLDEHLSIESRLRATDVVVGWRSLHQPIALLTRDRVSQHPFENILVASRLKRQQSIEAKLRRIPRLRLSEIQDIAGVRVVLPSLEDVRSLVSIEEGITDPARVASRTQDFIVRPAASGYRSIHVIDRWQDPSLGEVNVELQVRTRLQHAWATAVETTGTFTGQALKSSEGDARWLRYFQLVAVHFARLEGTPPPAGLPDWEDARFEIYGLTAELGAIQRFVGYREAATIIANRHEAEYEGLAKGLYWVIVMEFRPDNVVPEIHVHPFGADDLKEAQSLYAAEEARTRGKAEVVLVTAESIEDVRAAYPNYWADMAEFFAAMLKLYPTDV